MALRVLVILSMAIGAQASVSETVGQVCSLMDQMGGNQQEVSAAKIQALYGEFAGLFAETVDCSEDPFNPVFGFDLTNVPFMQCAAAKQARLAANPQAAYQLGQSTCIDRIIDADDKSAAIWLQFGNTGKIHKGDFHMRGACRYSFNDESKITAYHCVYDTYNLLNAHSTSLVAEENLHRGSLATFAFALFGAGALAAALLVNRRSTQKVSLLENAA